MATAVAAHETPKRRSVRRRYEHYFFSGMALLILATVLVGFAKTYFLAGMFRAPLPSWIIHIHGAVFSIWVLLFITQTSLVSLRRVDLHRKLGQAAFVWACLMVLLGVIAATDLLRRGDPTGAVDPRAFYAGTIGDMVLFAGLISFAFLMRFDPAAHKRFAILATITLMQAATARWPFEIVVRHPLIGSIAPYSFVLLLAAYDLFSLGRVHGVTLAGGAFLIIAQQLEPLIGKTLVWHRFAAWTEAIAKAVHGG